ncbi:MAG: flagellar basal body rod protein FlgC [Alphaproteobacteria bacterium]|nr:MAG: flagellar basal body rod protein FlgC [Alphaproteobacteria bacterium]
MDLSKAMDISASGLRAQGARIKVISENMANSESGPSRPGGEPYKRKTISFKAQVDKASGAEMVKVSGYGQDKTPPRMKFDPANPMADPDGYVPMPNINPVIEMTDMREAQRSYEANLSMIETSRSMIRSTLDLLK